MIALFWTSVSLMLLIAYSTIGLTVARIVDAWRRRVSECHRRQEYHDGKIYCPYCCKGEISFISGLFWPLLVPAFVLMRIVVMASRGSSKWSLYLVGIPERRAMRKTQLQNRITELEQELLDAV